MAAKEKYYHARGYRQNRRPEKKTPPTSGGSKPPSPGPLTSGVTKPPSLVCV